MKGDCGTTKKGAEINGGPGFKEAVGSERMPWEECVVTGEDPHCGGQQHMLRGHQQQGKTSWQIRRREQGKAGKGGREMGGRGDR